MELNLKKGPDPISNSRTKLIAANFSTRLLNNFLIQTLRFILWPIIVNGLGIKMYGAWNIILQIRSYLSLGNMKLTSSLGIVLAQKQHENDVKNKRSWVGAHIVASSYICIVILAIGLTFCWFAPFLFNLEPELHNKFRIALAISILMIPIGLFMGIPGMLLYSSNQPYRVFIPNTLIQLTAVSSSAFVVMAGAGIIGMSTVYAIEGFCIAFAAYVIAKRHVSWIGIRKPQPGQIKSLLTHGYRFQIDTLASIVTFSSSSLFLGYFLGLEAAGIFVITARLLNVGRQITQILSISMAPSFGDLYGRGEIDAFYKGWLQSITLTACIGSCFLGVIIPLNKPFIYLLLGPDRYGGNFLTFLTCAYSLLLMLQLPSAYALNQMLCFKEKLKWSIPWMISTIVVALILVPSFGLLGMAATYFIATLLTVSIGFPFSVGTKCGGNWPEVIRIHVQPIIPGVSIGILALFIITKHPPSNLLYLFLYGLIQGTIVTCACFYFGMNAHMRGTMKTRLKYVFKK